MANRQFKDSVFRKLFNNRKELAKLYQAIQPGIVVSPQDLKITTLRNVFLDSQKNDLSFLWKGTSVVLIEHQSTWNENMPLRMLPYIDKMYRKIIKERDAKRAMYLSPLVKIPTPKFYILYNGPKLAEPRPMLKLSDAFEDPEGGDLELRCHVIDISYDENNAILQACQPLRGYSYLVHLIHKNKVSGMTDDNAIHDAVLYCKDHGILKDFLKQFGKEVVNMFSLQWDEEEAKRYRDEYAMEQGMEKGMEKGMKEGIATATMKFIRNQLKRRVPYEQIAEDTETSLDEVLRIAKESNMVY
ncbi:MAG: Rpn family recombination-promoting nuclease/putative transposase [Selenomonas sp.]|uniref:Rpn family recombination-promoting nuclease/putative transposase n=2 Tax=Selenomonas sp. TaxID=2053611 RepID=UPI0025F64418|nr:Rpn family recombination-promoting nuclease/putative transposase [Selenomonas sp.]MCI6086315.1 Rpn family recombination-promoting nuclease/putative transposase [Selenomonas sp.]